MCLDEDPEDCAKCFSYWCIGLGAVCVGLNIVVLISIMRGGEPNFFNSPAIVIIQFIFGALVGLASIAAGILLLLGIFQDNPEYFRIGKYMTYPVPIMYFFLIFPPVVQVFGVLNLSEYRDDRWPESIEDQNEKKENVKQKEEE